MIEPHLFIFALQNYISQHRATDGSWSITPINIWYADIFQIILANSQYRYIFCFETTPRLFSAEITIKLFLIWVIF